MTTPLSTTTQGISAILRKAGHVRSVSTTTRIRGWYNVSAGFTLSKPTFQGDFIARLEYQPARWERDAPGAAQKHLEAYKTLLEGLGYKIETGGYSGPTPDNDHSLWISLPA